MPGRTIAIGDIHGCDVALEAMLQGLGVSKGDTVVVLGDVIDRGPGTRQAIERLLDLHRTCRVEFILGNHEEMLFDTLDRGVGPGAWLAFGGRETLESYGGRFEDFPEDHLEFLRSGLDYFETDSEIYVHASLQPGVPLEKQTAHWLRWQKFTGNEQPHPSGRRVVCGHSSQKWGVPFVGDGWLCIDTFAHGGMWLTSLVAETDELWQSNQSGVFRGPFAVSSLA